MAIILDKVSVVYALGTPFETKALEDVSLSIERGEALGILGHTGSGKSTLMKTLNALILPTSGTVTVDGVSTGEKKEVRSLRRKVGLVFQYPENQLFGDTVLEDVMFAPLNMGCGKSEAEEKAKEVLSLVGMGEEYYRRSPLRLSGGEKRKVAIAGILSMDPEYLVLDEPAAGLDGGSKAMLFALLDKLKKEGKGIVVVSHSIDDASEHMDRILVLEKGKVKAYGEGKAVFSSAITDLPQTLVLERELEKCGIRLDAGIRLDDVALSLAGRMKKEN